MLYTPNRYRYRIISKKCLIFIYTLAVFTMLQTGLSIYLSSIALPYLTLLRLPYFDKLSLHSFRHVFVVYIFIQIYPLPSFKLDSPHISHLLQAPIALPHTSTCLDKLYLLGFRKNFLVTMHFYRRQVSAFAVSRLLEFMRLSLYHTIAIKIYLPGVPIQRLH